MVSFSPAARDDLIDIALFIAEDNPKRAQTFVEELEDRCRAIGGTPGIGTLRPELGEGIAMIPHGRYLIFFRSMGKQVRIERIMHSARDIDGDDLQSS